MEPFEERSEEERTADRRGRQFGPRCPGPFPPEDLSLGPHLQGPSPGNQAGQKGGFTVLAGVGRRRMEKEGQLLALSPSCWGSELFFGTSTRSPRRWMEEELGI